MGQVKEFDQKMLLEILQFAHDKANEEQGLDAKKLVEEITTKLRPLLQETAK